MNNLNYLTKDKKKVNMKNKNKKNCIKCLYKLIIKLFIVSLKNVTYRLL